MFQIRIKEIGRFYVFFMQILRRVGFSENLPFNNFLKRTFYVSFYAKPIKRKI